MARAKKELEAVIQNLNLDPEIEALRKELRSKFGDDSLLVHDEAKPLDTISTGIISLDKALGGGVPLGRMVELLGPASSGKTTIILSTIVQAQKKFPDKTVVYIDAEHALDLVWAQKLGVDLNRFDHVQPDLAEDAIYVLEKYTESGLASIIAIDSVPALVPNAEAEGEIGDANIGLQARLIAQAMRRVGRILYRSKQTSLLFVNQKRAQLQSRGGFQGFEQTKATGGMALPFYMTTRLEVARIGTIKENEEEVGQTVQVHLRKHKVLTGPGPRVTFELRKDVGVDTAKEILDHLVKVNRVKKAGSWFTIEGTEGKFQGENAVKEIINQNIEKWKNEVNN